jgi:uncharacterized protein YfiM (DUF2279 family)
MNKKIGYIITVCIILFNLSFSSQYNQTVGKTKSNKIDKWLAIDKVQHFMYSTFVSLGTQYVLVNKLVLDEKSALPISTVLSFSAGLLKEINDKKGKNGFFSKKDMVANGFGIMFANIVILLPRE